MSPERVDRCVESLMKDPNFKPRPGKTKRESVWALCNWLEGQGKLKAISAGVEISMEKAETLFTGPFRVVLPIVGARRQIVEKAEGEEEVQIWLAVRASGPERDRDGDRFSEAGLEKMVAYAQASRLNFLDGHHRDLMAANLGEIFSPFLTEQKHFTFDVKLNQENPFAIQLFQDVLAGKRHGASIAGIVHDAEIEEYGEKGESGMVFNDVEIIEVSRTSWPSYRDSFITLLANKVGKLPQDEFDVIVQRRKEVIELTRKTAVPEVVTVKEDKQQEILDLVKGLVQTTEAAMKSSNEDKEEVVMSENKISSDEDKEKTMSKDNITPAAVEETLVEVPVVEMGLDKEPVVEQEAETVTETETETPPVEQEVEQSEVVGETQVESLAEKVDLQTLGTRFAQMTFAMQKMVEKAVGDKDLANAHTVIDDFATMGKGIISALISAGLTIDSKCFLAPFEDAIEMATGQLSKSRVDRIDAAVESFIKQGVELREVLKTIDAVDDSVAVVATEKAEQAEEAVSELAKQTDRLMEESKARSDELRRIAEALTVEPVREEVGPAVENSEEPIEISEENKYEYTKKKWLDGMRRK